MRELSRCNGTNGAGIFAHCEQALPGAGPFKLILQDKGPAPSDDSQDVMRLLGFPRAFDLIMVPPGAMVKPGEKILPITEDDKKSLLLQGVPFVPPYSKFVIAWQVAIAFGVVMPLLSQETPLAPVACIGMNCFMANMIMAPCRDGARYPMKVYLEKLNAMGASLLLGISMFSMMIESHPLYRATAVGSVVAACVSFNAHIHRIEKMLVSGCVDREAGKEIVMTFAGTSVEVFAVVATLYQISEQLGDKSAQAIATKIVAAMLIITQRENACKGICSVIDSLGYRRGQEQVLNDIDGQNTIENGNAVSKIGGVQYELLLLAPLF